MPFLNVPFSNTDRLILSTYSKLVDGLANYLGDGYEITLHSLEDLEHSIVKIIHGEYTGREVGAPISDFALNMLSHLNESGQDEYCAYNTTNRDGDPMKSTTILIRGDKNKPIAFLCINLYLKAPFSELMFPLLESSNILQENFAANSTELVHNSVVAATKICMADNKILPSNKNREIVRILSNQGIFRMKDGVIRVADEMQISRNTIYMHLRNVRDDDDEIQADL